MRWRAFIPILLVGAVILGGCRGGRPAAPAAEEEASALPTFTLISPAFGEGEAIPTRYTCDGEDISPPLRWEGVPAEARSLALIMDDPDAPAGTWVHWVLYNLPVKRQELAEAIPADAELVGGGRHGRNSWGRLGYGGPCPPSGTHRYFFKMYALDTVLDLEPGADKEQLLEAMEGRVLARAELMGTYRR